MLNVLNSAFEKYQEYQGNGFQMTIFWIALIWLALEYHHREEKEVSVIETYVIGVVVVFFCPLTAWIIMEYCIGELVYWRMLWLLPEIVIVALFFTRLYLHFKGTKKLIALLIMVAMIIMTGNGFFRFIHLSKVDNIEKLPSATISVCDSLKEHQAMYGDEQIRVIVTDELICSVRQYDATIKMPYGRAVLKGEQVHPIHEVLQDLSNQVEGLSELARQYGCNYLVYVASLDDDTRSRLQSTGYELLEETNGYLIFRLGEM